MSLSTDLNVNNRSYPQFTNLKLDNPSEKAALATRIINVAIPFLNLYRPTSIATTVSLAAFKAYHLIVQIKADVESGKVQFAVLHFVHLTVVVGFVAISILFPVAAIMVTHGYQLVTDTVNIPIALYKGEYFEAGKSLLSSVHTIVYIGSVVIAAPELIAISLIGQAALEIYRSHAEFSKGNILEGVANLTMASIRGYSAIPFLKICQSKYRVKKQDEPKKSEVKKEEPAKLVSKIEENLLERAVLTNLRLNQSTSIAGDGKAWDRATLTMQSDGNLVLYLYYQDICVPIWATGATGHRVEMRNGQLTLLTTSAYGLIPAWSSNNWKSPGSYFVLEKSPTKGARIGVYSSSNELVWASDLNIGWEYDNTPW